MRCEEVTEYMHRSLDNDLTRSEMTVMEEHLCSCDECQAMYKTLKELHEELENLPDVEPPISLVDAILPELGKSEEPPLSKKQKTAWKTWSLAAGGVAAALFLFIVVQQLFKEPDLHLAGIQDGAESQSAESMISPPETSENTQDQAAMVENQEGQEASPSEPSQTAEPSEEPMTMSLASEPTAQEGQAPQQKEAAVPPEAPQKKSTEGSAVPKEEQARGEEKKEDASQESEVAMAPPASQPEPAEPVQSLSAVEPTTEEEMTSDSADSRMSLAKSPPPEPDSFASPDGLWNARVEGQSVVILDQQGKEAFRSHEWEGAAYVSVEWIDSTKVLYTLYPANGGTEQPAEKPEKWLIHVKDRQEQKQ